MSGKQPAQREIDKSAQGFEDDELNRERFLGMGYTLLGVARNREHQIWLAGYRAGSGAPANQEGELGTETEESSESAGTEQSTCELPCEEADELPTKRMIKMYSEKQRRWLPLEATFDTGTSENWISARAVKVLELSVKVISTSRYRMFSGDILESSQVVDQVRWQGDNPETSARSRYTDFRVAQFDAPFSVLFGSKLIASENIYSFNDCALILTKLDEKEEEKKLREANRKKAEEEAQAVARQRKSSSRSAKGGNARSSKEGKRK